LLINEIMDEMRWWKMIAYDEKLHSVTILPMAARFIGKYPADFDKGEYADE